MTRNILKFSKGWMDMTYIMSVWIWPFWIYQEQVAWLWYNFTANQRKPHCTCENSNCPVGSFIWHWNVIKWPCLRSYTKCMTLLRVLYTLHVWIKTSHLYLFLFICFIFSFAKAIKRCSVYNIVCNFISISGSIKLRLLPQ